MGRFRGRGPIVLRYIQKFQDRHGHMRYYFRKPGLARVALPGEPGTPAFIAAYTAALNGPAAPLPTRAAPARAGTFHRLIDDYLDSPDFLRLKASSQKVTRAILLRFGAAHGHRMVADLERQHVMRLVAERSATPAAANNLLKKLRTLMAFAMLAGWRRDDPTAKVRKFREGTHHTWTDAEIAAFEARWPLGTRERTAFALALYTGQRRADVVAMTWADYDARNSTIEVVQQKTGARLTIPVHRDLRTALEAWPRRHLSILATPDGRGRSVAGFGNAMADAIGAAGLPDRCVLHGLRKAAARRLAEAGCSAPMIMAITGHKSLSEAERYTRAASQKGLAQDAITMLENVRRPNVSTRRKSLTKDG